MINIYTHNEVAAHWINSLKVSLNDYLFHVDMAKTVCMRYNQWVLQEVPIKYILTYINTSLNNDFFVNLKVDNYLSLNISLMPPIILVPIDRYNVKPFLEYKYNDNNLIWEPADGIHRLLVHCRLGLDTIKAYCPMENTNG